jgi:hypothetical protein
MVAGYTDGSNTVSDEWYTPVNKNDDDRTALYHIATREHANIEMLKRVSDMGDERLLMLVVRGMVAEYYDN